MVDNEGSAVREGVGGEPAMWARIVGRLKRWGNSCVESLGQRWMRWARPLSPGLLQGALVDATRSKADLIAENAQQPLRRVRPALGDGTRRPARGG